MAENIVSNALVRLFGVAFDGLQIGAGNDGRSVHPDSKAQQLENALADTAAPRLAKIYAYSVAGQFYQLPRPVLFLVHGEGAECGGLQGSGLAHDDWQLQSDVKAWNYDRLDYSMLCELHTGTVDELLTMLSGDNEGEVSSIRAGSSIMAARSIMASRHRFKG